MIGLEFAAPSGLWCAANRPQRGAFALMNTKKDEPEKKETAGAAGPPSPRPHATLDLKATVVDPKSGKDDKAAKDEKAPAASADPGKPGAPPGRSPAEPAAPRPGAAKPKATAGNEPPKEAAAEAASHAGQVRGPRRLFHASGGRRRRRHHRVAGSRHPRLPARA